MYRNIVRYTSILLSTNYVFMNQTHNEIINDISNDIPMDIQTKNNKNNNRKGTNLVEKIKLLKSEYPDSFELKYKINNILQHEEFIDVEVLLLLSDLKENNLKTSDLLMLKKLMLSQLETKNLVDTIKTFILQYNNSNIKFNELPEIIKNKLLEEIIHDYIITYSNKHIQTILTNLISKYETFEKNVMFFIGIINKLPIETKSKIILDFIYYDIDKDEHKLLRNLFKYTGIYITDIIHKIPINEGGFKIKCYNTLQYLQKSSPCDNLIDLSRQIPFNELNIKYISNCKSLDMNTQINTCIDYKNNKLDITTVKSDVRNFSSNLYTTAPMYIKEIIQCKNNNDFKNILKHKSEQNKYISCMFELNKPMKISKYYNIPNSTYLISNNIDGILLSDYNLEPSKIFINELNSFHKNIIDILFRYHTIYIMELDKLKYSNNNIYLIDVNNRIHINDSECDILSFMLIILTNNNNIEIQLFKLIDLIIDNAREHENIYCTNNINLQKIKHELMNIKNIEDRLTYLINTLMQSNIHVPYSIIKFNEQYNEIKNQKKHFNIDNNIDTYIIEQAYKNLEKKNFYDINILYD